MLELNFARPPEGCLSDLVFDEWNAGELSAEVQQEYELHLASCQRCQARQEELRDFAQAFLDARPFEATFAGLATKESRGLVREASDQQSDVGESDLTPMRVGESASNVIRPTRFWGAFGGAIIAAAAALFLWVGSPGSGDPLGTRSKGGERLGMYVKRGEQVFTWASGQTVRGGDRLRFVVNTTKATHLAILSLDGAKVASIYYPSTPEPRSIATVRDLSLDESVELDATVGEEHLFGVFCEESFDVEALRRGLAATGKLTPPPGCGVDELVFHKEPAVE
jgi:hypothetical protein